MTEDITIRVACGPIEHSYFFKDITEINKGYLNKTEERYIDENPDYFMTNNSGIENCKG